MSRILIFLSAVILAAFAALTVWHFNSPSEAYTGPASPAAPPSPVKACVNMGGALEAPREGEWGYTIRKSDFHLIRSLGFDTVRIPIKWSYHTGDGPEYLIDEHFFRRIDEVVTQAVEADLQVIINVHHYDEINENAEAEYPKLKAIWQQISARYEDWSDAVMYEFLNEPHTSVTPRRIDAINRDLLAMVRQTQPDRWVVLGGTQWGTLDGLIETDPPFDPRAMVTFHFYDPFEFTHQGAPWAHKQVPLGQKWGSATDRRDIAGSFARAARWRDKVGMPLLLGEFGVYTEVPDADRASWTNYVRRTAEMVDFGWCYWDWTTSLGMYDLQNEQVRPGMGEALFAQ